jgi:hypothetical protein
VPTLFISFCELAVVVTGERLVVLVIHHVSTICLKD